MYEELEKITWSALQNLKPKDEIILVTGLDCLRQETVHGRVRSIDSEALQLYTSLSLPVALAVNMHEYENVLTFLKDFNDPKYLRKARTFELNALLTGWDTYKVSSKEED